jgi:hypothetical protein
MMATVFFIVLQSSVPPEEGGNEVLRSVTGAGFYLLFGYFSVLWLMRRDTPRPLMMTLDHGRHAHRRGRGRQAIQPRCPPTR